jgi:hypothetical protein
VSGEKRFDSTGRPQYVRKSTQAEIDRRTGLIAKLYRRGHNTQEIATGMNVSEDVVRKTLRAISSNRGKRYRGRGPVTEACPWRDEDLPVVERHVTTEVEESRWRRSKIIGMAQMLNDEYRESNFTNILANQVTDAEAAGDKDWLIEALAHVTSAIEKLERARRVLVDDHYRVLCRDTLEGVEQMRHKVSVPLLRVISSGSPERSARCEES